MKFRTFDPRITRRGALGMCEMFTSILAGNQGEMRDFLQRGDKSGATEDYQRLAC